MISSIPPLTLATNAGRTLQAIYHTGIRPEDLQPFFDFMDYLITSGTTPEQRAENQKTLKIFESPYTLVNGNDLEIQLEKVPGEATVGKRIRELRKNKHWSMNELLAKMKELKESHYKDRPIPSHHIIQAWEINRSRVMKKYLFLLAKALEVDEREIDPFHKCF